MRCGRCFAVVFALLLGSCKPESNVTLRSSCFDVCVDASAHVDIDGQLAIAANIRDNFGDARAALASVTSVASALTRFVQSMVDLKPSMPAGLGYAGAGVYKMQVNADMSVEVEFYLPSNTSYGSAGDVIAFNLFDAANYFTSLGVKATTTVSLSGISTSLSFTFDKLGPGAELLGIGSTAASPFPIDVNAFSNQLSKVAVRAKVNIVGRSNAGNVTFSLSSDPLAAGVLGSTTAPLALGNFSAENAAFEQLVTLAGASLNFNNSSGNFEGVVRAHSISPDFGFEIAIKFDGGASGDINVGCLGAVL